MASNDLSMFALLRERAPAPLFGRAGENHPTKDGRYWYVDAENGSDRNGGASPRRALATLQAAIDRATNGAGDVIRVFPGSYPENVVVTGKNYLSIVNALQGYGRPDIGPATGMALHVDNSQGVYLRGLRLFSEGALADLTAAVGRLVRIEGNGFHIEDCVFDGAVGDHANSILLGLKGDTDDDAYTASEGRVINSLFRGAPGRALAFETAEPITGVGSTHVEVLGNRFMGNTGPDIITRASFGAGVYTVKEALIAFNRFMSAKNKATWIDLTTSISGAASAQTGQILGNWFADDDLDATAIKMSGTGFTVVGNYDTVGVQDGSAFDD